MDKHRLSGILIILSFVWFLIGSVVAPSGAYEGDDLQARLSIIDENQAQWYLSKVFDALVTVTSAIAFGLLAWHLRDKQAVRPLAIGAGAFSIAAILGLVYVYRLAVVPGPTWEVPFPEPLSFSLVLFFLAGELTFSLVFIQGNFPTWLGYFTLAMAVLGLALAIIFSAFGPFPILAFLFLVNLVPGIMIVRGAGK